MADKKNIWNILHCYEQIREKINTDNAYLNSFNKSSEVNNRIYGEYTVIQILDNGNIKVRDENGKEKTVNLIGVAPLTNNEPYKLYLSNFLNKNIYLDFGENVSVNSKNETLAYAFNSNGDLLQKEMLLNKVGRYKNETINTQYNNVLELAEIAGKNNKRIDFRSILNSLQEYSTENQNIEYNDEELFIRMIQQNKTGEPMSDEKKLYTKQEFYDTIAYALLYDFEGDKRYLSKEHNEEGLDFFAKELNNENFSDLELAEIKRKVTISLIDIQIQNGLKKAIASSNEERYRNSKEYILLNMLSSTYLELEKYDNYNYLDLTKREITYNIYNSDGTITTKKENALEAFDSLTKENGEFNIFKDFLKDGLNKSDLDTESTMYDKESKDIGSNGSLLEKLLSEGLESDIQHYLQFNSNKMIEFDLVANKYYSSIDAYIFFDGVKVSEITFLEWELIENIVPIYSYASYTYDAIAKGARIVNGSLMLNFTKSNYIESILQKINKTSDIKTEEGITTTNSIYRQLFGAANDGLSDESKKQALRKIIIEGNDNNIKNIAGILEKDLWGVNYDSAINRYERPHFNTSLSTGTDKGFDIIIPWGNSMFNLANVTSNNNEALTIINDVHFTGESQTIKIGPDNIQQKFNFIAKDLNSSILTNNELYEINKNKN